MFSFMAYRKSLFAAILLGLATFGQPALSAGFLVNPKLLPAGGGQQAASFNWPTNSINLSQLQQIFSQFPGISQFNFQFPNQMNWSTTPNAVQQLYNSYLQQAQSFGMSGTLPELSFSSLNTNSLKSGLSTFSIGSLGNFNNQMGQMMQQFRYEQLHLNWMPEWMKRFVVALYDAFLQAYNFMQSKLMMAFR